MAGQSLNGNSDGDIPVKIAADGSVEPLIESAGRTSESDSKSIGEDFPTINPGDIIRSSDESGDGYRGSKRRGRPRGSKNSGTGGSTRKETSQDLTGVLLSIHLMLAKMMDVEELILDEKEAKQLSDAALRVSELYGGFVVPEKVMAWVGLIGTAGSIYVPRMMAYNLREKKKKPQVVNIHNAKVL